MEKGRGIVLRPFLCYTKGYCGGIAMNLPILFEEKMRKLLGNEFDDYIKCYDEKRLYGLRVNTKKISTKNINLCTLIKSIF